MLIQCSCGKTVHVKDSLIGKKVRCPACKKVLATRSEKEEKDQFQEVEELPPRPRKRKGAVGFEEGEDQLEAPFVKKKGVSWTRIIVSAVILVILIVVGGFIVLKRFSKSALRLEVTMASVDIFIDGQKIDYEVPTKRGGLSLVVDLEPGTHEIKVTKDKFHPFIKQVTISANQTETLSVDLKRSRLLCRWMQQLSSNFKEPGW